MWIELSLLFAISPAASGGVLEAQACARVEIVARVGETRFLAVNPGELPQLLLFGDPARGVRAALVLPPGGEIESRFPTSALEGLALELVSSTPAGLASSGAFWLEPLRDERYDAVLMAGSPSGTLAFGERGGSVQALAPDCALTSLAASAGPIAASLLPAHVPVATPADKKNGDLPPRMENKPLPPM